MDWGGGVRRSRPLCGRPSGVSKPRGPAFPLVIKDGVEAAGFEPAASSVRVGGGPPLCRRAFALVAADRWG